MGCGMFGIDNEKSSSQIVRFSRGSKRTQVIDCRRHSTKVVDVILENIELLHKQIPDEELKFISSVLKQHDLFSALGEGQVEEIAKMMMIAIPKGEYLFRQDDPATCFFIIGQGLVDIEISGTYKRTLKKGDCFGELALLYFSHRTASVKSVSPNLKLYILKSKNFKNLLKTRNEKSKQITQAILEKIQIFSFLTTKQKYSLVKNFKRKRFEDGDILFRKYEVAREFFIVESGKVKIQFDSQEKKDLVIGELQSFGEAALRKEGHREGTVIAVGSIVCHIIEKKVMEKSLGDKINNIIFENIKKWTLKNSPIFSHLTNHEVEMLALEFRTKQAKPQDIILDQGCPINKMIICLQGKINSKGPGTLFNDEYFHLTSPIELQNQIMMNSSGSFAEIHFTQVKEMLDKFQKRKLRKSRQSLLSSKKITASPQVRESFSLKENSGLNLREFDYLKELGKGQFGEVHLIKQKRLGILFALKIINKRAIEAENMEQRLCSERDILSSISHSLIAGYYKAFHDKFRVYFLLEYINGIEMYYVIRQIGILNKNITRFYFASVLSAIEYLHSVSIIYRDLKPENCMVDFHGRVFLVDMGTAKQLKKQNGFRTDTIVGTPHYLAPQVLQGRGYSNQADYWSLGVFLYELIAGKLPFGENREDPYDIYGEVMRNKVTFPKFVKDIQEKVLVLKLLQKNPSDRSVDGGLKQMKKSSYFNGFYWEDLEEGKMMGPYIPKCFKGEKKNKYENGYPLVDFLQNLTKRKQTLKIEDWVNDSIK